MSATPVTGKARWGIAAGLAVLVVSLTQRAALADSPSHHTVSAQDRTSHTVGEVVIRDDALVGRRIVKATYQLYDGYEKTVLIPHGGAPLKAVDIANCHRAGVYSSPPWPCSPVLHTSEVIYGDTGGHRFGSPDRFNAGLHASETATGTGDYLTVGEIDHGGMVRVTYRDAGGGIFRINFRKAAGIIIYRVVFQPGKGYSAVIRPLVGRNFSARDGVSR
jgi:hypothetical protein